MKYVLLLLVFYASAVYGTVYSWVDSQGIRHYANREYDIPVRYRTKAKALYPEQGDTGAPQQNVPAPQVKPEAQPPAPVLPTKPEEPVRVTPPGITPAPKNIPQEEQGARRGRRSRETTVE